MNIKTSDLKRFRKLSSHISGSGILPSSNTIKFGGGLIIRASGESFVSMECADSDEEMLVDEKSLWIVVDKAPADFVSISTKGNKTTLFGGLDKVPIPAISVKDYVEIPKNGSAKKPISGEFLLALGKAAEGATPMSHTTRTAYMYVHVGRKAAVAGNGFMAVLFPIEEDYQLVLEKKASALLSKQDIYEYSDHGNHYFFYGEDFVISYTKQEFGYFSAMRDLLVGGDQLTFSVSASDIIGANDMAILLTKENGVATLSTGKFEMYDSATEIGQIREFPGIVLKEPFSYLPANMNRAIMPMGAETLDFYDGKGLYYIKSPDTKATAIIAKISK